MICYYGRTMSPTNLPLFVQFGSFPQTWRKFEFDDDDLEATKKMIKWEIETIGAYLKRRRGKESLA